MSDIWKSKLKKYKFLKYILKHRYKNTLINNK